MNEDSGMQAQRRLLAAMVDLLLPLVLLNILTLLAVIGFGVAILEAVS